MDSDPEKENYFFLYMKKRKNESKNRPNFCSCKKVKNKYVSIQKLKDNNKKSDKLLLESSEKKNKSNVSLIKSYLFSFNNSEKYNKGYVPRIKKLVIDKQKLKNERINKSSKYIKTKEIINKNNNKYNNDMINEKNNLIYLNSNITYKNNNEQKIETLKNRIYNLIDIIDNFEKNYINNTEPLQIKEQLNNIKYKIASPIHHQKDNINKNYNINYINEHLYATERIHYNPNQQKQNFKNNYIKYYDKKLLTKKITSSNKKTRAISTKIKDKNKIITLKFKQNNKKTNIINNSNNSTFVKLVLSNSSSVEELNTNNKNKAIYLNGKSNSNSCTNKKLIGKNKEEDTIFKRRINYCNFINQKMKKRIIHRNKEINIKQNIINKSSYSNSNNNSKACIFPKDINNKNINDIILTENNKSNTIDKKIKIINCK